MWDLGNSWTDARNAPTTSYNTMMHEIHVLLVDHDTKALINTTEMLELCQYKVTIVELASAAITMLSSGKVKFDIVMANINSPDLHAFKLLQQATSMDILVFLMSVDYNISMAKKSLENGAFMYIKKPIPFDTLKTLWQHVLREKTRAMREGDISVAANCNTRGVEIREPMQRSAEQSPNYNNGGNDTVVMMDKGKDKTKIKRRKGANGEDGYGQQNHMMLNNKVKRKVCTEWTHELHRKFLHAVEQLGEGRCFPKEILELMNVPGLTRMQVASHLQKCRNDNWRPPKERKPHHQLAPSSPSDVDESQHKPRRFGSMPRLGQALLQEAKMGGSSSGQGNEEAKSVMCNQNFASVSVGPSNVRNGTNSSSSNSRLRDDFFHLSDMDTLMQNMSVLPEESRMNNLNQARRENRFDPIYHYQQNPTMRNMNMRSQWSSETSNLGSGENEGKGSRE